MQRQTMREIKAEDAEKLHVDFLQKYIKKK